MRNIDAYQEALERMAIKYGKGPVQLEEELGRAVNDTTPTAKVCITLVELEKYPNLPKNNSEHAEGCDYCTKLIKYMLLLTEPNSQE